MQRFIRLCFLQVILISIVSFSSISYSAEQGGIRIRGPKASDAFPYDRYGPLTNKDTLWNIALKVRPDPRLTVYQVMTALYQQNPQAFKDNNLNHLINGEYLTIPDIDVMRTINPNSAKQKSEKDDKKSALCRFRNYDVPLRPVYTYKDVWGLSANNKEQKYAMDLLFDKDIPARFNLARAKS